ncbi:DUF736 domain-containing protein [Brevundimonas sp.]|uniref:DUF736 domain-containing protein n=1 Tax=Brevundimonas sp. TaxID=1871086 RepID=UPI0025BC8397|nr:DUF736 domain-containing protein [Brevundimonas sp.]
MKSKCPEFRPSRSTRQSPSPRITVNWMVSGWVAKEHSFGQTEFGAAWKKTSQQNRDYLSVKLDDPSFPAPIYASLVEIEGGHSLIWSR